MGTPRGSCSTNARSLSPPSRAELCGRLKKIRNDKANLQELTMQQQRALIAVKQERELLHADQLQKLEAQRVQLEEQLAELQTNLKQLRERSTWQAERVRLEDEVANARS